MIEYIVVALAAVFISVLTFYSGFGLGTLLMPVFAIFMPVELAVVATAVVHFANNIFKVGVTWRSADLSIVLRFGIPAVAAAFVGAALLGVASSAAPLVTYEFAGRIAHITTAKLVISALMFIFAALELLPRFTNMTIDRRYLILGGLVSGFFGGLSGHQGALRSVFLTKAGITTEAFVGTTALIGFLVDTGRLVVYAVTIFIVGHGLGMNQSITSLVAIAIISALFGVMLSRRYLKKVKMRSVQYITGGLLVVIAALLASGII